jgi:uncharacterized protein
VSETLPTTDQALQFLEYSGCSKHVIRHAKAVSKLAVEIAEACNENGCSVNPELVRVGGLLHDIGRAETHSVHHAVKGAQIAESLGLPESIISIIKRHVGGGITEEEARKLGWPEDVYTPERLEEKIVSYADKLIDNSRRVPIEDRIQKLSKDLPSNSIERIRRLHTEILGLTGDCRCTL